MGNGMTTQERTNLDDHITGGGSPGLADEAEDFGAPIVMAWYMLDGHRSPLPAELVEAIDKAIDEDGYKSVTAITLLKGFYGKFDGSIATAEFARGWLKGVDMEELNPVNATANGNWEVEHFSYMLGHLSGDFAYNLNWATPYEKTEEEADEAAVADALTSAEQNEGRDESEQIEVHHLATDEDNT